MRCLWRMMVGLVLLMLAQPVRAQTSNQAGLVIVHGDGRVVSRCVAFSEPQISGYDLLQRAGLDLNIEVNGVGVAICRLDGEGCSYPQQSCFCGTESDSSHYWSYWQWGNGAWQYSNQGAANQIVQPGTVQGWAWGVNTANNAATPPLALTFAEVCAPPTPTPSVTPSPPPTPTPLATATLSPTPTALPPTLTPTNWPTLPPTATPTPWPTATALPVATATAPWTPTLAPPQITLFTGNPLTLTAGGTATLLWQVQNANQVVLRSAAGESPLGPVGNLVVQPPQTSTYVLVARNSSGEVTATVELVVVAPALPTAIQQPAAALSAPTSVLPTPVAAAPAPAAPPLPTALPNTPLPPPILSTPLPPPILSTPLPPPILSTPLPPAPAPTIPALAAVAVLTNTVAPTTVLAALPNLQAIASPVLVMAPDAAAARLQLLTLLGGVVLVLVVPLGLLGLVALLWLVKQRP